MNNPEKKTKIVIAPFICTIPGGGLQSVACFPDAETFFYKKKKYGYSKSARTLIAPVKGSLSEAREAKTHYFQKKKEGSF